MLFSLVIPAYNAEGRIRKLLRSVAPAMRAVPPEKLEAVGDISRNLGDWGREADEGINVAPEELEVIVVDDASVDGTVEKANMELSVMPCVGRTVRLRKNSGGGGVPRNRGVREARGEYILFADADDWFTPGALARVKASVEEFGRPDAVGIPYRLIFSDGRHAPRERPVTAWSLEESPKHCVGPWAKAVKRSVFVPFPEGTTADDASQHFRQMDAISSWGWVRGPACYVYDRKSGGITDSFDWLFTHPMPGRAEDLGELARNGWEKNGPTLRWQAPADALLAAADLYRVGHGLRNERVVKAWRHRMDTCWARCRDGRFGY